MLTMYIQETFPQLKHAPPYKTNTRLFPRQHTQGLRWRPQLEPQLNVINLPSAEELLAPNVVLWRTRKATHYSEE